MNGLTGLYNVSPAFTFMLFDGPAYLYVYLSRDDPRPNNDTT